MDSLRDKAGIGDSDFVAGECRTRGLSISVGAAERGVVCMFFRDPNIDFRVEGREGGMNTVAVGVEGSEIGWRRVRGGGREGVVWSKTPSRGTVSMEGGEDTRGISGAIVSEMGCS